MEFESWWLLAVPLFFGLGWLAARVDLRQSPARRGQLPDAYFRGLNFLLNEQADKAIDAFIDVVKLDPETIELHFALGNLFRRRGESDRAIRVHLNLVERSDLDARQREHALYELGQDYLKAGLLDRAEDAFNRLEKSGYAGAAIRHRLEIAQMVRDWPLAIDLAQQLGRDTGDSLADEIAHFHCELAMRELEDKQAGSLEDAIRNVDAATRFAPDHPRSLLLAGEIALQQADPARAIRIWDAVAVTHPAYLSLLAKPWLDAHAELDVAERGLSVLIDVHRENPSIDLLSVIADAMVVRDGAESAIAWVESALREAPSLLGLEKLMALRLSQAQGAQREQISLSQQVLKPQTDRLARFGCSRCGFKARRHYWQCPGCGRWDTYSPRRGEQSDR